MLRLLMHKHVLSGLMFVGVAIFGLIVSRDYSVGTTLRMGTGYVPRLLCWILLGLGLVILLQGVRAARAGAEGDRLEGWGWRPLVFVTASLVIFGLALERLGLVISILLVTGVGALASPMLRPVETIAAAVVLIALSWGIFIFGLGLTIPVWPEW
jgi:putative tricarboxylic transport membrane protein